jgi:hypothetical protein
MDRAEKDETPAAVWQASLNATCNRLSTQYLNLLRSASSAAALDPGLGGQDPRGWFTLLFSHILSNDVDLTFVLFVVVLDWIVLLFFSVHSWWRCDERCK